MDHKARAPRPRTRDAFTIAILCVLEPEYNPVRAIFDECWDDEPYGRAPKDQNTYSVGNIGGHNVVLVFVPGMGKLNAANAGNGLKLSFKYIELCLLVGVCGAPPTHPDTKAEILLGDVIISDQLMQTDFGRQYPDGVHTKNSISESLGRPKPSIRSHLGQLKGKETLELLHDNTAEFLQAILRRSGFAASRSLCKENDNLYRPTYRHKHRPPSPCVECAKGEDQACEKALNSTCMELGCSPEMLIHRPRIGQGPLDWRPSIHLGKFSSSDQVMKSALHRDKLSTGMSIAGFEMEGAGIWEHFPTYVIKSACDYADSHKSKVWQEYAGAVAASCLKAFLKTWAPADHSQLSDVDTMEDLTFDRTQQCLRALKATDPQQGRASILARKDEVLPSTCDWIYVHPAFSEWSQGRGSPLFWLHGDPGKGKTMIMMDLVTKMEEKLSSPDVVAYFFCQGAVSSANTATAILRGLIYHILSERHDLQKHVIKRLYSSEADLLEGPKALQLLWQILSDMVSDPGISKIYLLIDGLDECVGNVKELLKLMSKEDRKLPEKARWIVSSRDDSDLQKLLSKISGDQHISLESNVSHVTLAVEKYIKSKVKELAKYWNNPTLEQKVQNYLIRTANGTFLWAALACEGLQGADPWNVQDILREWPPGLDQIYHRMMETIKSSKDANLQRRLICAVSITRKTLTFPEACFVANLPTAMSKTPQYVASLAKQCGSFLTVQGHEVSFVHQTALEYIITDGASTIFPSGRVKAHADVAFRSIELMSKRLHMDICELKSPGALVEDVTDQQIESAIQPDLRYACLFWARHLKMAIGKAKTPMLSDYIVWLSKFFQKSSLFWLEALSLLGELSVASKALEYFAEESEVGHIILPRSATALVYLLTPDMIEQRIDSDDLKAAIKDLQLFVKTFRTGIEKAPLQVYHSGLTFAPPGSQMLLAHSHLRRGLRSNQRIAQWDSSLHVLEGHREGITAIAFSPDGNQLASASTDNSVLIWDAGSGRLLHTLEIHTAEVTSMAFSEADKKVLVSGSKDSSAVIWSIPDEDPVHELFEEHTDSVLSVTVSKNGLLVATGSADCTIMIWNMKSGELMHTMDGHHDVVSQVTFSPSTNELLASISMDGSVQLWNAAVGQQLTLNDLDQDDFANTLTFSPDGQMVAAGFYSGQVKIYSTVHVASHFYAGNMGLWNRVTLEPTCLLETESWPIQCVAFSHDGRTIAAAGDDKEIKLLSMSTKTLIGSLQGHLGWVQSVAFSHDDKSLVSGSDDCTIRVWDVSQHRAIEILEGHSGSVVLLGFSPRGDLLASAASDWTVRLWNSTSGKARQGRSRTSPHEHLAPIICAEFSKDGSCLITGSEDFDVRMWDPTTSSCMGVLRGHTGSVKCVAFSEQAGLAGSGSVDGTARIWGTESRSCLAVLDHEAPVIEVAFLACAGGVMTLSQGEIRIWNREGDVVYRMDGWRLRTVAISPDGNLMAKNGWDQLTILKADTGVTIETRPYSEKYNTQQPAKLREALGWHDPDDESTQPGGLELTEDKRWITHNGERQLWLPANVKPICYARNPDFIAIGSALGHVLFITYSDDWNFSTPAWKTEDTEMDVI